MKKLLLSSLFAVASSGAMATALTTTSPAGGALPGGFSAIGGIVADFVGTNGGRLTAQRAASGLFNNTPNTTAGDVTIGSQGGFTAGNVATLGGTLSSAAFRITLFDGDNASGNFDFDTNFLMIDGIEVGNFSLVPTEVTNNDGTSTISSQNGFPGSALATGWFSVTDPTVLANLLAALADGSLTYVLDQRVNNLSQTYNFAAGLAESVVNVEVPPTPGGGNAVPTPGSAALLGLGLLGVTCLRRRA